VIAEVIKLSHGSGGLLSRQLIEGKLLKFFDSPLLAPLTDSALLNLDGRRIAFTTDSYVVDPIFFPGGDIGKLAVYGTVNDLAVAGAEPAFISCSLIIEQGLPTESLDRILDSMRQAARAADVEVVTGDTKVVPKGKADKIFINTAGLGTVTQQADGLAHPPAAGDCVILSGAVGEHEAAVLARREGLNLESTIESDCAPLTHIARAVLVNAARVSFMRDVTRGGLATILNEAVAGTALGVALNEAQVPVKGGVRAACELLGLDPLYMACEGRLVALVDAPSAEAVREAVRAAANGKDCAIVGQVSDRYPGKVTAQTPFGTRRLLQMLSGEQLPRIC